MLKLIPSYHLALYIHYLDKTQMKFIKIHDEHNLNDGVLLTHTDWLLMKKILM